VLFNNESWANAIAILAWRLQEPECGLRFFEFQPIDTIVGQQHRVRAKRKRRRAYLQRKKATLRASGARAAPGKQRAKNEPDTTE
jgi:hypothetical protein